jgi:hypothetical protein
MATREELYQKFGMTAEAAQLLETSLGTVLFAVRALHNGWHLMPNPEQARTELDRVEESTLGTLLKEIRQYVDLQDDLPSIFLSAIRTRNRLMHGFYERHNFKILTDTGRDKMLADLESMHEELVMAWQRAEAIGEAMCSLIQQHDQSQREATKH